MSRGTFIPESGTVGAVVLCGGRSQRMGQPKAWIRFGNEFLLQRVVRLVAEGTAYGPLVVVAAPGQELPPLPSGTRITCDAVPGRGPLEGMAAGMDLLGSEASLAYVTSTDVPFLNPGWIRLLVKRIGDADIAIPHCQGFRHVLAALYRPATVLPCARALLDTDRLRPAFLLETLKVVELGPEELQAVDPELATLWNVNTPEQLRQALHAAGLPSAQG